MTHYQLQYVLHLPSEDTGGMFMADIPVLPGCRAWGNTEQETIEILQNVAEEFIASYNTHGDEIPADVMSSKSDEESILVLA